LTWCSLRCTKLALTWGLSSLAFAVARTTEFERIAALPRRKLRQVDAVAWATVLTPKFREADAPSSARLRPWQAFALAETMSMGGGFFALPVGFGKTLLTWLLPTALDAERAVLIVPANLREKTAEDYAAYRGTWVAPRNGIRVMARSELQLAKNASMLEDYAPDLIMIDESDELQNARASTVKRIDRYVRAKPGVRVVAMSGTPGRLSIMNYWHLMCWCLGDGAPLPLTESEARMWAMAIDEGWRGKRPHLGPLGRTLKEARERYRRRLLETPGVVLVDGDSCDQPLTVRWRLARECPETDARFERFAVDQETPGGIVVSDGLSRWRLDAQLGQGFYTRWNPPPPERWRTAYRTCAAFVRERIDASASSARPLDTELQVLRRYESHPVVREWREVKPTFKGQTEAVWFSRTTLDSVLDWIREHAPRPVLVWCGSTDFAHALARDARLPYYGPDGKTAGGARLLQADARRSLIVSWNANKKGFDNLKAWPRQLIVMPPQSAKWLEQVLGRPHRSGQREPVVVDILITSGGTADAFERALEEAAFNRSTLTLTQKLLRAEIVRTRPTITPRNEYRWARKGGNWN